MRKLLISLFFLTALPHMAHAVNQQTKVYDAEVNKGTWDIQLNSDMYADEESPLVDNTKNFEGEINYGFTDTFEFGAEFLGHENDAEGFQYDMTGLNFTFQFAEEKDGSPVAAALRASYDLSHNGQTADIASGMLIFSHKGESFEYNLDIGVFSEVGDFANQDLSGDFRASMNYVFNSLFKPGVEYYTQTAELDHVENYSDQQNRVGPVIYGNITEGLSYEAGYLFALSDTAPEATYKLNLQYKMDLDDLRNPEGY
jgi:hypothetical protein